MKATKAIKPNVNGRSLAIEERVINLDDPNLSALGEIAIRVEGVSPLIVNNPSAKMDRMLEDQMGKPKGKKAPKVLERDYLESLICIGKTPETVAESQSGSIQYGVPAIWWKCVAVRCGGLSDFKMTELRCSLFVPSTHGLLVPLLDHSKPRMRTDRVRLQGKTADMRTRAEFEEWACEFTMVFNTRVVTPEQVVAFLQHGGQCNGVGEWRPDRNGSFGQFRVVKAKAKMPTLKA